MIELNNSNHSIVSVVTNTDRKSGRGLKLNQSFVKRKAMDLNIPIIEVDDVKSDYLVDSLTSLKADLFVVVAFKFLPDSIISIPKYGSINIHPSLLPRYRGSSPIQYALINGDSETGVSIIHLNNKIDSGNILGQKKIYIDSNETFGELSQKLSVLGSKLLIEVIDNIGNTEKSLVQNDSERTLAPKIKKDDLRIDWDCSAVKIHNKIRAFDPYPGAYSFINKKRIKLFGSSLLDLKTSTQAVNGQIIIENDSLKIKTGSGYISIDMLQVEGKNKIHSSDFIKSLNKQDYILE